MPSWRRLAFAHVADRCNVLMQYITQQGPESVLDVDELLLRESMDVMGGYTQSPLLSWHWINPKSFQSHPENN
jgi:hypothetical protein